MVTPVNRTGGLDEVAVDRLVDYLIAGGVNGVFVLGTTGEGVSVPHELRRQLVERTVRRVHGRALVYAGISGLQPNETVAGNQYFQVGADVVVACPPVEFPTDLVLGWFRALLDGLKGPLMMYNIPQTTKVSIPLPVVESLLGHPRLIGLKDSENNAKRLEELMQRFGGRPGFSLFVGVGALMARGLRMGADGIVPSVGNLIPDICHQLFSCAQRGDWAGVELHAARMNVVAGLYQTGRTLGESLAALKAALYCRGICEPNVLPPLSPLSEGETQQLRGQMSQLKLLSSTP
jgi:4-hydroxy-tetrahydrodipicolinate synthase